MTAPTPTPGGRYPSYLPGVSPEADRLLDHQTRLASDPHAAHWVVYDWGADLPLAFLRYSIAFEPPYPPGTRERFGGFPVAIARGLTMDAANALADRREAEHRAPSPAA